MTMHGQNHIKYIQSSVTSFTAKSLLQLTQLFNSSYPTVLYQYSTLIIHQ